jgi:uncharacterized protein YkwD
VAGARTGLPDAINTARAEGCAGKPGVTILLRQQRKLDAAARSLAKGVALQEALDKADYHALHSSSLQISNAGDDKAIARALQQRSCEALVDPAVRDVGIARSGGNVWVLLAAPIAAPQLHDAAAVRRRILELTNEARSGPLRCGSREFEKALPLRLAPALETAARTHSEDMAKHNTVSHAGSDGSAPQDRATRAGYLWRVVGENVAGGPTTPEEVMHGWLGSPAHCENIMDPRFVELGVAVVVDPKSKLGIYWTQMFGVPR